MPTRLENQVYKAIDLEQIIVEMGHTSCDDPGVKTAALAELSRRRGRAIPDASEDTWALVRVYLGDRFSQPTHQCAVRGASPNCVTCGERVLP